MSEKLDLANKYYEVARDLRVQERYYRDTAVTLERIADLLCEQNMRETAPETGAKE